MKGQNRRDEPIDKLLRSSFPTDPPSGAPAGCIDAETLAVWTDGRLPSRDAARVEAHVAGCASCQEMLAVFARTEPVAAPAPSLWQRLHLRWAVPIAAAATAAAIWVAVPEDRRGTDEFAQTIAPAIEAPSVPAEKSTDADAPEPLEENKLQSPRREAPGALLADRAETKALEKSEEQKKEQVQEQDLAATAQRAAAEPEFAPSSPAPAQERTPQTAAAAARAANASMPPPPSDESRGRAQERADSLRRQAPATEAAGTGGILRWRIVPRGRLERSMNGGETWESVPLPPSVVATGVRAVDNSAIVTASDGREFRTDDRGKNWNLVQP